MHLPEKLSDMVYSYTPNEFLPIYYDGELDNGQEFVAFRLKVGGLFPGQQTALDEEIEPVETLVGLYFGDPQLRDEVRRRFGPASRSVVRPD